MLRKSILSVFTLTRSYTTSSLGKHISFFANTDGDVTTSSVTEKLMLLGDTESEAKKKALVIMAAAGTSVKYCPFRKFQPEEAVGVLNHANSTGIYNLDGSINEKRWEKLVEFSELDQGVKIITQSRLREFLEDCRAMDTRSDFFGIGKAASDGEWVDFFDKFSDHRKHNEACITLAALRKFYVDGANAFQDVANKVNSVSRSHQ